jgi:hypothetical protein
MRNNKGQKETTTTNTRAEKTFISLNEHITVMPVLNSSSDGMASDIHPMAKPVKA